MRLGRRSTARPERCRSCRRGGARPRGSSWRCSSLAFVVYACRRSGSYAAAAPRGAAVARPGGRDPARPARGAAAALDRRLDVLGVRADRGGARRQPVRRRRRSEFPARSGVRPRRARRGATRRRSTGRRFTLLSEGVALRRRLLRDAAAWIFKALAALAVLACALLAARLARDASVRARARRLEPAARDALRRRRPQRRADDGARRSPRSRSARCRPARPRPAWPGRVAILVKWVPVVFLAPARRSRRARAGRRVEPRRLRRRAASRSPPLATLALRPRLAARLRPARAQRRGRRATRSPHRLEQLGVPHGARARRSPGSRSLPARLAGARGACAAAPVLGLAGCLLLARRRGCAVVRDLGAAARGRRGRPARTAVALGFCAYLLPQTIPSSAAGRRGRRPRRRRAEARVPPQRARAAARARAGLDAVEVAQAASVDHHPLRLLEQREAEDPLVAPRGARRGCSSR